MGKVDNLRRRARLKMRKWINKSITNDLVPRCVYCGIFLTKEILTIDHIVPLSKGGSNCKTNLVTSCQQCNCRKDDNVWTPSFEMFVNLRESI